MDTTNMQQAKNRSEEQRQLAVNIIVIEQEMALMQDPRAKELLSDTLSKMQTEINYFRDMAESTYAAVFDDGIVTNEEVAQLDRLDNFLFVEYTKLRGMVAQLESAGVPVPANLRLGMEYLFRKLEQTQDNTAKARNTVNDSSNEFADTLEVNRLRGVVASDILHGHAHAVQNKAVKRRISIRTFSENETELLKSLNLYEEVSHQTLATKRFRDAEYGRAM